MASKTTNYNLHKIDLTDAPPDITVFNDNFDTIDNVLELRGEQISENVTSIEAHINDRTNPHHVAADQISSIWGTDVDDALYKKADKDLSNITEEAHKNVISRIVEATSNDGVTYTATVSGLNELYKGLELTIIPNKINTAEDITLVINDTLSAKIMVRMATKSNTSLGKVPIGFLYANYPIRIFYMGESWYTDIQATHLTDTMLFSELSIKHGGTGANTVEQARVNLGAAPQYEYGTNDLTAGTSELTTGTLYFVYE